MCRVMFQEFHAVDSYNWYLGRVSWRGWLCGLQDSIGVIFSLSFPFIADVAIQRNALVEVPRYARRMLRDRLTSGCIELRDLGLRSLSGCALAVVDV